MTKDLKFRYNFQIGMDKYMQNSMQSNVADVQFIVPAVAMTCTSVQYFIAIYCDVNVDIHMI